MVLVSVETGIAGGGGGGGGDCLCLSHSLQLQMGVRRYHRLWRPTDVHSEP